MALEHQGEALAHFSRGFADGHGAGDVGGAVQILGAGIHQQQGAGFGALVQPMGRAIVDHGAVGRRAGDGVEGQVLERAGVGAEAFELAHHLDLVGQAVLSLGGGPVQEAGQGGAVADMGLAGAFDLDRVLAGAGQGAGVGAANDDGARVFQGLEIPGRGLARIDQHPAAFQLGQGGGQGLGRFQANPIAEPAEQFRRDLDWVEEQARRAVGVEDGLAQGQGRADHVAAADIEQPGDGGWRGEHRGLGAAVLQPGAHAQALVDRGLAGKRQGVGHDLGRGLRRARLAPGLVERIDRHRLQSRTGLVGGHAQAVQRFRAVQPGVIADGLASRGGAFQIGRHAALDQVAHFEQGAVHLVAHLQGVAAVDEHRRPVLQDHRRSGRAGEARGPGQAVIGRRQIFVLMLVLMRHQKAVQALGPHGLPDQRHMLGAEGGIGGFIEGLVHRRNLTVRADLRQGRHGLSRPGLSRQTLRTRSPQPPPCVRTRPHSPGSLHPASPGRCFS